MRVVHICQRDDPDIGGSLRVAEALVREQRKLGVEAWILFLYGPPSGIARDLSPYAVCLGLHSSREAINGVFALKSAIRRIKPDVIHAHDGLYWPRLVMIQLRTPVVMHAHLSVGNYGKSIPWLLIKHTTDLLIGISKHTMNSWIQSGYPEEKVRYIQNGVDLERFSMADAQTRQRIRRQLGLPENKKILLWLGRLHRGMKGVERIERVGQMLPDDAVLVVVGNGPEYDGMLERNADLIRSGRMVMAGSSITPQVYYQAADAFLFTSHYEPFGLVILEAVASGLPILSFPVDKGGGATELLKEFLACQIQDESSQAEIQCAINYVFSNSTTAEKGREMVRAKYAWSTKAPQVVDVYRKVLGMPEKHIDGNPRVLVCQHGARHRYAIPRMLNEAGMLSALYTDSSEESSIGKCVKFLGALAPKDWRKISRWDIRDVPRRKIYSTDSPYAYEVIQKLFRPGKEGIELYHQRHLILSDSMKRWGLQDANIVYSMYHEDLEFIRWAKDRGARSVVDVFISPITDQIMEMESVSFPDWIEVSDENMIKFERALWDETVAMADLLLCPSEWVAEGVRSTSPAAASKIRIVPYGCSIDYAGQVNRPVRGRVLFAGNDPLRKGLHYLAQAASSLKGSFAELDVRVAGDIGEKVKDHPLCRDLNFLGSLDGERMKKEFLSADVFVLPALSEGFAGVVAEAIGAGCPVIVTKEAGSPVIHEREGLLVPSRDVEALTEAIRRIITDRDLRDRCAMHCMEQAVFYSEAHWRDRLVRELCAYAEE